MNICKCGEPVFIDSIGREYSKCRKCLNKNKKGQKAWNKGISTEPWQNKIKIPNGYMNKQNIIKKYGISFYRKINKYYMELISHTDIKQGKPTYYLEEDIEKVFKGTIKTKCRICGSDKNMYSYNICKKCYSKIISNNGKNKWTVEKRKKQSLIALKNNKYRLEKAIKKYKEFIEKNNNKILEYIYLNNNLYKIKILCKCGNIYYKYITQINIDFKNNDFEKYSCEFCRDNISLCSNEDFINKCKVKYKDKYDYSKIVYKGIDKEITVIDKKYGEYKTTASGFYYREVLHPKIRNIGSKGQREVLDFVKEIYSGKILDNNRPLIIDENNKRKNKEIDIYLPELKFGIEYNGLFNHCEFSRRTKTFSDKNKHLIKQELAIKQGIKLIQITSEQWKYKQEIVKDIIRRNIIRQKQIYGRKTTIKVIDVKIAKQFINENHIQGYAKSNIKLGLYYNNELIQVMTFGKPRMSKKYDYEIIRLCTKKGLSVLGGTSKLYKYFKEKYKPKSVITYADRSLFTGEVYKKLGFKFSHYSTPNYRYTKDYEITFPRQQFQKHKLKNILDKYDENFTEWENMLNNNWNRYWDCGNSVFVVNY